MIYHVLITGANRGIGLALCKQYSQAGWQVSACCRSPEKAQELNLLAEQWSSLSLWKLDITNEQHLAQLQANIGGNKIDVLINNAGVYGSQDTLMNLHLEQWQQVMAVNVMAPLRLTVALNRNIAISQLKKIAFISSKMGSIADNSSGGHYYYRSSKSALNAVVKNLAVDLQPQKITVASIHPGWVKTAMGGPNALIDTQASAKGIKQVVDNLTIESSGQFIDYQSNQIFW